MSPHGGFLHKQEKKTRRLPVYALSSLCAFQSRSLSSLNAFQSKRFSVYALVAICSIFGRLQQKSLLNRDVTAQSETSLGTRFPSYITCAFQSYLHSFKSTCFQFYAVSCLYAFQSTHSLLHYLFVPSFLDSTFYLHLTSLLFSYEGSEIIMPVDRICEVT